ncbi:MAG TPA: cytochrome b/b6 domain-containing protein [Devosia sp.]
MRLKSTSTHYGAVAMTIHWVSAAAIFGLLISGTIMTGAGEGVKASILPVHATIGVTVLLLTLLRIGWWRWADKRPQPVANQPHSQHLAARIVHGLLYAGIIVLAASGIATLAFSGAIPALLAGTAPPDFSELPPRLAHGLVGKALIALVVLHAGAALYHQFIRRDRLLGRMGVGPA